MGFLFQITKRNVIPNWRDYKRTVASGELDSNVKKSVPNLTIDISKQIKDWKLEQSMGIAADLLSAAYLSADKKNSEILEASQFIINNPSIASKPLLDIAKEILTQKESQLNDPIESKTIDDIVRIDSARTLQSISNLIKGVKRDVSFQPGNPIWYVELSRLYSILGQNHQASRAMQIALHLAPDNRFVLRSATRLYVHNSDPEQALYHLRKSKRTKTDPWLLSAHISTTSVAEKFQVNAKIGLEVVKSQNFSPFDVTELASALGTLEFSNDAIKSSKSLFEISRVSPNDNSLAQLEWISKKDKRFTFNPLDYTNIPNSYEAFALEQFQQGNWMQVLNYAIRWLYDIPYSSRPVTLGSFICSAFLDEHEVAIKLCKLGLIANPNDPQILNNLLYAYAMSGQVDQAIATSLQLNVFRPGDVPDATVIAFQATYGLIQLKAGNIEEGKQSYDKAIDNARRIKRRDLEVLAYSNYLRELMNLNDPSTEGVFFSFSTIDTTGVEPYAIYLRNRVISDYEAFKRRLV